MRAGKQYMHMHIFCEYSYIMYKGVCMHACTYCIDKKSQDCSHVCILSILQRHYIHVFNLHIMYTYINMIYIIHIIYYIYLYINSYLINYHCAFSISCGSVWLFEAAGLPRGSQGIARSSGARPHGGHQI